MELKLELKKADKLKIIVCDSGRVYDSIPAVIPIYQLSKSKSPGEDNVGVYEFPAAIRDSLLSTMNEVSLAGLQGKYLLVFTNDVHGFHTGPQNYPLGFYVDDNGMIIHDNYNGVSLPFEEFLEMLETPVRKNINTSRSSEAILFHPLNNGSLSVTVPFDILTDKIQTAIYDLSGALISRQIIPVYSSAATVRFTSLSKGIYTVVISGRDSAKKPFRAAVHHCVTK